MFRTASIFVGLVIVVVAATTVGGCRCGNEGLPAPTASTSASTQKSAPHTPTNTPANTPTRQFPPADRSRVSQLPFGAMLYVAARPTAVDHVFAIYPDPIRNKAAGKLEEFLGTPAPDGAAITAALGLDAQRPILFATLAPAPKAVKPIAEQFAADPKGKGKKALGEIPSLKPPPALFFRVQFPLATADTSKLYGRLSHILGAKAQLCSATKGDACGPKKHQPHAIFKGERLGLTYLKAKLLTLDLAWPLLTKPDSPQLLEALVKLYENKGGPTKTRCEALDLGAAVSVCIDPDAAAQYGEFSSLCRLLSVVSVTGIDPEQLTKISQIGLRESASLQPMAQRAPKWLDDGTVSLGGTPGQTQLLGSWLATKDSRQRLAKQWSKQRCVDSTMQLKELLSSLRETFGDPGSEFKNLQDRLEEFRGAGWSAWPIAVGRTWPLYLGMLLGKPGQLFPPFSGKYCLRFNKGRLEFEAKIDANAMRSQFPVRPGGPQSRPPGGLQSRPPSGPYGRPPGPPPGGPPGPPPGGPPGPPPGGPH